MFNLYFRPYVPGFRVKPRDEFPGFNVGESGDPSREVPGFNVEGNAQREGGWFGDASTIPNFPTSSQPPTPTPLVNPYYPALGTSPFAGVHSGTAQSEDHGLSSIFPVADDRDAAWAKCHARCVPLTVGKGDGSGAPGRYRRCRRDGLAQHGHFDY